MDSELTSIDRNSAERARDLVNRLADLLAHFESVEVQIRDRERQLTEHLLAQEAAITEKYQQINMLLTEFSEILTEPGIARWRLAAEQSVKNSKDMVVKFESSIEEFRQLGNQTCERLDRVVGYSVKSINDATNTIRATDFKQLVEDSCHRVEFTASTAVKNISKVAQWFYWKKVVLVFSFSMMVAMVTGMYINSEWPWEMHQDIVRERDAGSAVMKAWSQLSPHDKELIASYSKHPDSVAG